MYLMFKSFKVKCVLCGYIKLMVCEHNTIPVETQLVVWVAGKTLTSVVGHADSARLSAGPPGLSSSSSCGPWSNGSGCRQTSSHPCR